MGDDLDLLRQTYWKGIDGPFPNATSVKTRLPMLAIAACAGHAWRQPISYIRGFPLIVVFDIGNVLLRWDRRNLFRKRFDDDARLERFLSTALDMDFVSHTDVAPNFAGAVAARAKAYPNSPTN